jgi:YesN/AraC family two-component response regulator
LDSSKTGIILISGHDDFSYAQQALRQGAFDYFLKPVEADDLVACFGQWMKQREQAMLEQAVPTPPVSVNELSPVEQVIYHIATDQRFDMTLAEAAELVHLNPSYFCKLFKQHKRTTFTEYVTNIRMKEAVRLLENTSLRVTEIAERLGYADPAYFSNTFKKTIGRTPSDLRKQPQTET